MFTYKKKVNNYYLEFKMRHGQSFRVIRSVLGENPKFHFVGNDAGYSYYLAESTSTFAILIEGCTLESQICEAKIY